VTRSVQKNVRQMAGAQKCNLGKRSNKSAKMLELVPQGITYPVPKNGVRGFETEPLCGPPPGQKRKDKTRSGGRKANGGSDRLSVRGKTAAA